jgi:G:T-mismatch repair DNA endonuclease (very short patch repair protein)
LDFLGWRTLTIWECHMNDMNNLRDMIILFLET